MKNHGISNGYYYKVTGDINKDTGGIITNPVLKIGLGGIESAAQTGVYQCKYEVYSSESDYLNGFFFQKAWDVVNNVRVKDFTAPYDPSMDGFNAPEKQKEILANQFGWDVANIELVANPVEEEPIEEA